MFPTNALGKAKSIHICSPWDGDVSSTTSQIVSVGHSDSVGLLLGFLDLGAFGALDLAFSRALVANLFFSFDSFSVSVRGTSGLVDLEGVVPFPFGAGGLVLMK